MSGNLALLALPDDQRLHVQLSPYFYVSTLAKLRNDIGGHRTGIVVFELTAPINAPLIHVAMDRCSAYVLGFRPAAGSHWWAFRETGKPLPTLPGAASRPMQLSGSYTELGLPSSINMRPEHVLAQLAGFRGSPDPRFCQAIVLLLFLVAEALRFDSVLLECVRYFSMSYGTIHPSQFARTVRDWNITPASDPDVLLPYCG